MSNHRLRFDGYFVGDRLLEDVAFAVDIQLDGESMEIGAITLWNEEDDSYLERINLDYFRPLIRRKVAHAIDNLKRESLSRSKPLAYILTEWEEESGEPGIQVLFET